MPSSMQEEIAPSSSLTKVQGVMVSAFAESVVRLSPAKMEKKLLGISRLPMGETIGTADLGASTSLKMDCILVTYSRRI